MTTATAGDRFNLGPAERIPPGEGRVFTVGELRVAVFRARDGRVYATQADCPHRQGPLADGLLGGGVVTCPLHARKWELSTGAPVGNDCPPLATYPVEVSGAGELLLLLRRAAA
jgi:nitrite reductase (NADH) small subunit